MSEVDFRAMSELKAAFLALILGVIVWFVLGDEYANYDRFMWSISGWFVAFCVMAWLSKCKECNKKFSTKIIDKKLLSEEIVQGNKEIKLKNGNKRTVNAAFEVRKFRVYTKCEACGFSDSYAVSSKKEI
ncbi:hypothetical protein [Campylobacter sp.]|uniref:hypothetical protein n=1 Tax=Campylobacter sp. TaxID=205 RepID=UPI0027038B64|nr:hypothetical protein [Campylobacter sp.]